MPSSRRSCHLTDQAQVPHCWWVLYHLSHQESSRILEWVAYVSSMGSSRPRNWIGVSCTAGDSLPAELPGTPRKFKQGLALLPRIECSGYSQVWSHYWWAQGFWPALFLTWASSPLLRQPGGNMLNSGHKDVKLYFWSSKRSAHIPPVKHEGQYGGEFVCIICCYITNHFRTWWHKTTIGDQLAQFCKLPDFNWMVLLVILGVSDVAAVRQWLVLAHPEWLHSPGWCFGRDGWKIGARCWDGQTSIVRAVLGPLPVPTAVLCLHVVSPAEWLNFLHGGLHSKEHKSKKLPPSRCTTSFLSHLLIKASYKPDPYSTWKGTTQGCEHQEIWCIRVHLCLLATTVLKRCWSVDFANIH